MSSSENRSLCYGDDNVAQSHHAVYSYYKNQHYDKLEQYEPMNLKHLYYFWQVAKHGGVMRAGEAIHISPQTLSGQIKLLEERLGTALFQRQGRRLELTEAAHPCVLAIMSHHL